MSRLKAYRTIAKSASDVLIDLVVRLILSIALLTALSNCSTLNPQVPKEDQLFYTIEPLSDDTLKVTMEFLGSDEGITYIKHNKTWAGNDFTQDVGNFIVKNEGSTLEDFNKGHEKNITKVIKHKHTEKLKVTYTITQNVLTPDKTYRAIVKKNFFHLIGHAGLATPSNKDENKNYLLYESKLNLGIGCHYLLL